VKHPKANYGEHRHGIQEGLGIPEGATTEQVWEILAERGDEKPTWGQVIFLLGRLNGGSSLTAAQADVLLARWAPLQSKLQSISGSSSPGKTLNNLVIKFLDLSLAPISRNAGFGNAGALYAAELAREFGSKPPPKKKKGAGTATPTSSSPSAGVQRAAAAQEALDLREGQLEFREACLEKEEVQLTLSSLRAIDREASKQLKGRMQLDAWQEDCEVRADGLIYDQKLLGQRQKRVRLREDSVQHRENETDTLIDSWKEQMEENELFEDEARIPNFRPRIVAEAGQP